MTHRLAWSAPLLLLAALVGCSSDSTPSTGAGATPTSAASAPTPTPATPTPPTPSASVGSPAPTSTDTSAESLGEQMGAKIAFYAVAKAAGMTESAKMDELASGICSRIESGKPADVGPWVKDTFDLEGDVAAKVAVIAIEVHCPEFKSQMGL